MAGQFSLTHFWQQGDAVSHAVAFALLAMSLLSWFFILAKLYAAVRVRRSAPAVQAFWDAPTMADGVAALTLADPEKIYLPLAQGAAAQLAVPDHPTLGGEMDRAAQLTRVLRAAIQRSTNRLEGGLTVLASIGATAPFVGLLGTVWGIMNAFRGLANVQQATLAAVAPGIAEALIATAIGLFAAIPAVVAYNRFTHDIDRLAIRFESFVEEFSNILQRQSR